MDEFTAALTAFQAVQRKTVELEKNAVRQARGAVQISKPPSANNSQSNSANLFEDNFTSASNKSNLQMQAQQEEVDLQALEEQERTIRELEVDLMHINLFVN